MPDTRQRAPHVSLSSLRTLRFPISRDHNNYFKYHKLTLTALILEYPLLEEASESQEISLNYCHSGVEMLNSDSARARKDSNLFTEKLTRGYLVASKSYQWIVQLATEHQLLPEFFGSLGS